MNNTKISWTNLTWNVWSGCKQISPGCGRCYAKELAERFRGTAGFPNGFDLTYRWHKLKDPLKTKKSSMIFVNSMSDLYLEDVPVDAIQQVFDVMNRAHWHQFQVLTKRTKRMLEIMNRVTWTPNIWQGVSVENQRWTIRIDDLLLTPAKVKFLSAEPLLGSLDLTSWITRLDWVIVGGESDWRGHFRKMNPDWARSIKNQCERAGVAFFYKQGNGTKPGMDSYLDGVEYHQMPDAHSALGQLQLF